MAAIEEASDGLFVALAFEPGGEALLQPAAEASQAPGADAERDEDGDEDACLGGEPDEIGEVEPL